MEEAKIDSQTSGDPARFRPLRDLEVGLEELRASPKEDGRVALIVRRGEGGAREVLEQAELAPDAGIPGDAWARRAERNPEMEIAVMEAGVARLIANGQPLGLFGDELFLELDLSVENLPEGSRIEIGAAELEVTPMPHNGCRKFQSRFGSDALRFVSKPELRHRNLRGIFVRVIRAGTIRPGDGIRVVQRGLSPRAESAG